MVEVKNVTKSSAELKTEFCAAKSLVMDELYCINRNIDKIITEPCVEKNVLQKKQSIAKKVNLYLSLGHFNCITKLSSNIHETSSNLDFKNSFQNSNSNLSKEYHNFQTRNF